MSKIQILCTTMNQKDLAKYYEMNIQSDVIFANQTSEYRYTETKIDNNNVKMISTNQRGVGRNRNTALLNATEDICVFADDDVIYVDDYPFIINKAFNDIPDADIIIFNLTTNSNRKPKNSSNIRRCRIWNILSYGTYRIGFRLQKVKQANIWFTQLFGGGAKYPSGEDTMWLLDALRKGLKIYTYPVVIGLVKQEDSTWFKGYDKEYFFGRGALVEAALPRVKYLMFLYYIVRFRNLATLNTKEILKMLLLGAKAFNDNLSFNEVNNTKG